MSTARLVLLVLASPLLAPSREAQSRKLSAPLPRAVLGDVLEQHFSPDGSRVVFRADRDRDEVVELWSVPADGSGPELKISAPMPDSGDVLDFCIAPDSATVVYRADASADEVVELWRAPIGASGGAVKIGPTLWSAGDVQAGYVVDPGSQRVLYRATYVVQPFQELFRLMSVNLSGDPVPVDLFGDLATHGTIRGFDLAPDGQHVLFVADQHDDGEWLVRRDLAALGAPEVLHSVASGVIQSGVTSTPDGSRLLFRMTMGSGASDLWSLPADGSGAPTRLSRLSGTRRGILRHEMSPDGSRVAYVADQDTFDKYELYSAPVDGSSEPVKLNGTLANSAQVRTGIGFSADGSRYVYRRDTLLGNGWAFDLFSVPSDGSAAATHLAGPPGVYDGPFHAAVGATGRVVFANLDVPRKLSSVPIDGSATPLVLDQLLSCSSFELLDGGDRVLYSSGCEGVNSGAALLVAQADGGSAPIVLESAGAYGAGGAFELDAADERVLYRREASGSGVVQAWVAPLDGSGPNLLNAPFPPNTFIGSVTAFAASNERATYLMNKQLLSVNVLGEPVAFELAPGVVATSGPGYELTHAGDRVLFVAIVPGPGLYSAPVDGSAPAIELSTGHGGSTSFVKDFRLSPDGTRVAYTLSQDGTVRLFLVPVDGSAPPVPVSGNLVPNGTVRDDYRFTPDGARLVYRADQLTDEVIELFSGDGIGPPVRLNPTLSVAADIGEFRISADGSRVIFPAHAGSYHLLSAPVDGSAPALGIAFPPTQYVRFEVCPSSPEVVYHSAAGIFRTPFDAAAPVALASFQSGPLVDLEITPDGSRAVYIADAQVRGEYELFSVALDASAPPVELSLVTAIGGDVLEFQLTPDSSRVVYRADQGVNERFDVYSVPVTTRTGLQKLDPTLASDRDVTHFRLSPDGAFVVYRADQDQNEVFELHAAPIGGQREAVRLHHALAHGDVAPDFDFTPDSRQVLFLLDRAAPNAHELHAAWIPGRARPATAR